MRTLRWQFDIPVGDYTKLFEWAEVTTKGRRRLNNIRRFWLVGQLGKCAARTRGVIQVFYERDWVWQVKSDPNTSILAGFTARWLKIESASTNRFVIRREPWNIARDGPYAAHRTDWKWLWHFRRNRKVGLGRVELLREINKCAWFFMRSVLHWRGCWRREYFTFRGQYAVVKRCKEKATGKEFAAKFVRKRRKGKDCRAEVWHEVEVLNATNYPQQHPQIIKLYDVFETRSEVILILELWVFFFLHRVRVFIHTFIQTRTYCDVVLMFLNPTAHLAEICIGTVSRTIPMNLLRVEAKEKWCFYSDRFSKA